MYFTRTYEKIFSLLIFLTAKLCSFSQGPPPILPCTEAGYVVSKPIILCGKDPVYIKTLQTPCSSGEVAVPFCGSLGLPPPKDAFYKIFSPVFFKFKCYGSGTLGFIIDPEIFIEENFDWQIFDVTGQDPQYIYKDSRYVIGGSWSPKKGITGAQPRGIPYFYCLPDVANTAPPVDPPAFSEMPELIKDHEYILMVCRVKDRSVAGFTLKFEEGTADITDPLKPKITGTKAECSGTEITVKFNKKISCASLTPTGSEFIIQSTTATVVAAVAEDCSSSNGFEELKLTLSAPLIDGTYKLILQNGTDGNTLLDLCKNPIPANETMSFDFTIPQPIFADSVAKPACTPDSVKIYFPKKITCATISPAGTDFSITGPQPLNIIAAGGNCKDGKTDFISLKFDKAITTKGTYEITLKAGNDGSPIVDECGVATPEQTISFTVADTVNADFTYSTKFGCRQDTLTFVHDGAHDVNKWNWIINKQLAATSQTTIFFWSAASTHDVLLYVTNGTCIDSSLVSIKLDNEVKAVFSSEDFICPEDKLVVSNASIGNVDRWKWTYDILGTSTAKDPVPFQFPTINKEAYYTIKLVAYNDLLNCSDTARKTLTVLDFCLIDVATAFTPNNDGLNDTFSPHNAVKADNLIFKVYNRNGQLVFQSKNWRDRWDGKMNSINQPPGVYVWMLSYTNRDTKKPVFQKGTVMLIR